MTKIKRAKRQTVVTRTLHRKLKIGLHEFNKKTGSELSEMILKRKCVRMIMSKC